jgi:hypothetical protein
VNIVDFARIKRSGLESRVTDNASSKEAEMNRHERRKAAKVAEIKWGRLADITHVCGWKGCEATCDPDQNGDLPSGWSAMLLTRSFRHVANLLDIPPGDCLRDSTLCPEHTRLFDSQLKDLHRELTGPVAGSA